MQKDLKSTEEMLRQRETQLDEQWQNRPMEVTDVEVPLIIAESKVLGHREAQIYLAHQLARSKNERKLLSQELKVQQTKFQELFDNAQLLENENTALQHKRELFDAVRRRRAGVSSPLTGEGDRACGDAR